MKQICYSSSQNFSPLNIKLLKTYWKYVFCLVNMLRRKGGENVKISQVWGNKTGRTLLSQSLTSLSLSCKAGMINYTWSTTHSVLDIILVAESSKIHVHVLKPGFYMYVLKLETYLHWWLGLWCNSWLLCRRNMALKIK